MRLPWVSREAHDEAIRQRDLWYRIVRMCVPAEAYEERGRRIAQLEQEIARLTELRLQGFVAAKPGRVRDTPDVETQARHRAEQVFIDNARAAIINQTGADPVTAEREAERLRRETTDMQPGV